MKLVGMLDSPYVRRVAISLDLYGVDFEHQPLSVFSTYEQFASINPKRRPQLIESCCHSKPARASKTCS